MSGIRIVTGILAVSLAAGGCDGATNPVGPDGERSDLLPGTSTETSVLSGLEEVNYTFDAVAPVGSALSDASSLSVSVTDLLGLGFSAYEASDGSTPASGEVQEGEEMTFQGNLKTKTQKVRYADGSSVWRTETTTGATQGTGKQSGGQCKNHESFMFQGDNPGGATTFTQQVKIATICQGSGRTMWLHILIHFTVTPNGKVASNFQKVWIANN